MSRPGEDHSAGGSGGGGGGSALTISSELMVAAVIFLFMVVVFVFFLYLYANHYLTSSRLRRSRGAHFIFPASEQGPDPNPRRLGLDAQVLKALPVSVFRPAEFKDGLECPVCLTELSEGEKLRQLPKCKHGFHIDCIDMWFQSHSTCPLCRTSVASDSGAGVEAGEHSPSPVFPTNVLFWGTQDRVNNVPAERSTNISPSSLVIEIPTRAAEALEGSLIPSPITPLPSSSFPPVVEEINSPKPADSGSGGSTARFKSFRRLLSQGKRAIGSSWSPRGGGDIEQGVGANSGEGSSQLGPKAPTTS